ncbi:MAG: dihydrofolate reductase family protein [Gemmatimonadota bacterium]
MPPGRAKPAKKAPSRNAAPPATTGSGQVHLYVGISLDGYIATPDGGVAWLDPYQDARAGFMPFIETIGSALMGRTTYDHAVKGGHADFGMPAYVVTHRPFTPPSPSVVPYSGDLRELVRQIRERHTKDIWLIGGGSLTKALADADLIDIWSVAFVPTLLGAGLPMFPARTPAELRLKLVKTHAYPSGVVELRYERH